MAAPVPVLTVLHEDRNRVVLKVDIPLLGDAEITASKIADMSTFTVGATPTSLILTEIHASLHGFAAQLLWDADANVVAFILAASSDNVSFDHFGGIPNNAGAGVTGDLLLTTSGIGAADTGSLILEFEKVV